MRAGFSKGDAVGGVTTFFTMSYIVVVNPAILSTEGTGMSFSGVLTATVVVSFLSTLLMGLYARLPFALAPGMGINAFFTFSLVLGRGIPWPTALGIVFWSGVLFFLASVTPLREQIARAIPKSLRLAAAAGIGLFLTFIGLKNAGLVAADPVTFVKPGSLGAPQLIAVLSLALTLVLIRKKSPFAFLAGIAAATGAGAALGLVERPASWFSAPDFSLAFGLDAFGALRLSFVPAMLTLLFTDLFDSLSTFMGVSTATGLVDKKGDPLRLREGLLVDALATLSSGLFGTSSATTYIESASGVEAGARTGAASVVTALCFLPCLFLAPVAGMVPPFATAPVLILVGWMMFRSAGELAWEKMEDSLPAFLTIVLIPLTFSITQGMLWGFISHAGLYLAAGRRKNLHPVMLGLAAVSIGLLAL